MLVIIKNESKLEGKIKAGKAFVQKGHTAFENKEEAEKWGNSHIGHGRFKVYPLCEECTDDSFSSMGTMKYPTMKKVLRKIKISNEE
jgi:hypothetical protein